MCATFEDTVYEAPSPQSWIFHNLVTWNVLNDGRVETTPCKILYDKFQYGLVLDKAFDTDTLDQETPSYWPHSYDEMIEFVEPNWPDMSHTAIEYLWGESTEYNKQTCFDMLGACYHKWRFDDGRKSLASVSVTSDSSNNSIGRNTEEASIFKKRSQIDSDNTPTPRLAPDVPLLFSFTDKDSECPSLSKHKPPFLSSLEFHTAGKHGNGVHRNRSVKSIIEEAVAKDVEELNCSLACMYVSGPVASALCNVFGCRQFATKITKISVRRRTGTMNRKEAADNLKNLDKNLKKCTPLQFISELDRYAANDGTIQDVQEDRVLRDIGRAFGQTTLLS
ncbi:hypothetical protein L3Y34_013581 [Caenorhabditis briggsae]|uniref:Uncharacterized protein n=1 Tax=Caenorhabditis briggsae TaxID=6238 RepID=A0AAE8ZVJ7_CAEBR|nr:hypothetical protein L3Y34_013581 [Caenorhabditis briggsae]